MKFMRSVIGYSLLDEKRIENMREELEILNLMIKFNSI
jgi:hypothetical protein